MKRCPFCGTENDDTRKWCSACFKELQTPELGEAKPEDPFREVNKSFGEKSSGKDIDTEPGPDKIDPFKIFNQRSAEQAEKERLERLAKEQAERERFAREQAERERLAREQAERKRLAREQAERERFAREKAERERFAREQAERERLAREQAERERLAREQEKKKRRRVLTAVAAGLCCILLFIFFKESASQPSSSSDSLRTDSAGDLNDGSTSNSSNTGWNGTQSGSNPDSFCSELDESRIQEENGIQFMQDQLSVVAESGVSYQQIEQLCREKNYIIIGYVASARLYELRLPETYDLNSLDRVATELQADPMIASAIPDYVWDFSLEPLNDDPWGNAADWSGEIKGKNWGVVAIQAPWCWENYDLPSIKIGVFDRCFDENHEDVYFSWVSSDNSKIFRRANGISMLHGTHVSGIIGATHNNGLGLAGVMENCQLYGATIGQKNAEIHVIEKMEYLLSCGVKVFNFSMGYGKETDFVVAANKGNTEAIELYKKASINIRNELRAFLENGYDFVFAISAGNDGPEFDARFGTPFSYVSDPEIKNRIIVVGAVYTNWDMTMYSLCSFSNTGTRVDVLAPGQDIYSAVPTSHVYEGYYSYSGTSMAAPFVTGVCASVWAADPSLSGAEVKRIVVETADIPVSGTNVNMINMRAALERVKPPVETVEETVDVKYAYMEFLRTAGFGSDCRYAFCDSNGNGIEELYCIYSSSDSYYVKLEIYEWQNGTIRQLYQDTQPDAGAPGLAFLLINDGTLIRYLLNGEMKSEDVWEQWEEYAVIDTNTFRVKKTYTAYTDFSISSGEELGNNCSCDGIPISCTEIPTWAGPYSYLVEYGSQAWTGGFAGPRETAGEQINGILKYRESEYVPERLSAVSAEDFEMAMYRNGHTSPSSSAASAEFADIEQLEDYRVYDPEQSGLGAVYFRFDSSGTAEEYFEMAFSDINPDDIQTSIAGSNYRFAASTIGEVHYIILQVENTLMYFVGTNDYFSALHIYSILNCFGTDYFVLSHHDPVYYY